MHNTHFIVTNAESKEQAEQETTTLLDNWGDENNYYTINEVLELGKDNDLIQERLDFLNKYTGEEETQRTQDMLDNYMSRLDSGDLNVYWQLSEDFKKMYYLRRIKEPYTIDNLVHCEDFFGYTYDEFGITNRVWLSDDSEEDKIYLIKIDMHS